MWKKCSKKTHKKKTWGYARLLIRQKGSASKSKTKSIRNVRFADGEGGLTTSFYKIN